MTYKDLDPRLITLAKITPKVWGKQILKRNTFLLKKLNLIRKYVKNGKRIPDALINKVIEDENIGSPHCIRSILVMFVALWLFL